jgi:hypothetical protein
MRNPNIDTTKAPTRSSACRSAAIARRHRRRTTTNASSKIRSAARRRHADLSAAGTVVDRNDVDTARGETDEAWSTAPTPAPAIGATTP